MAPVWTIPQLSAASIVANVRLEMLSAEVVLCGIETGAIDTRTAVEIELLRLLADFTLTEAELAVAASFRSEEGDVPDLLRRASNTPRDDHTLRLWTFLGVRAIRQRGRGDVRSMDDEISNFILSMGEVEEYLDFVVFLPRSRFRKKHGSKSYVDVFDERLKADARLFGWDC